MRETAESECVKESACVHEGEIHHMDNEFIWDGMRQSTSPVVVSSIQDEDIFPTWSRWTVSLNMDGNAPTVEFSTSQVCLHRNTLYLMGLFRYMLFFIQNKASPCLLLTAKFNKEDIKIKFIYYNIMY